MSKITDSLAETIVSKPKAMKVALLLVLLLVEVGNVIADGGTTGP